MIVTSACDIRDVGVAVHENRVSITIVLDDGDVVSLRVGRGSDGALNLLKAVLHMARKTGLDEIVREAMR